MSLNAPNGKVRSRAKPVRNGNRATKTEYVGKVAVINYIPE